MGCATQYYVCDIKEAILNKSMKLLPNHKYCLAITLIAFLMNAMLPFFAVYNVSSMSNKQGYAHTMASLLGDKVLLCTQNGFKWVSLTDLVSGKKIPEPHPKYECPLCYIVVRELNDVLPPHATRLIYQLTPHLLHDVFPFIQAIVWRPILLRNYLIRSPPIPAIA